MAHDTPEKFLKKLIEPGVKHTIVYQAEIFKEYRDVEQKLKKELEAKDVDVELMPIWNSTLHHVDDLPYDPAEYCAHGYSNFRKQHANV